MEDFGTIPLKQRPGKARKRGPEEGGILLFGCPLLRKTRMLPVFDPGLARLPAQSATAVGQSPGQGAEVDGSLVWLNSAEGAWVRRSLQAGYLRRRAPTANRPNPAKPASTRVEGSGTAGDWVFVTGMTAPTWLPVTPSMVYWKVDW